MRSRLEILARVIYTTIWLISLLYGVIAYVPFTYVQVIETRLVEPLLTFAAWHGAFAIGAWVALIVALLRRLQRGDIDAWLLMILIGLAAIYLQVRPTLSTMRNEPRSLWIGLVMVIPVLWLVWIDVLSMRRKVRWVAATDPSPSDGRLLVACASAAVFDWVVFSGVAWSRAGSPVAIEQATWSLPAHLVVFAVIFVSITLLTGLSLTTKRPPRVEFWLTAIIVWLAVTGLVLRVILAPMSFTGSLATLAALTLSAGVVGSWVSVALLIRGAAGRPVERGVELFLSPSGRSRSPMASAIVAIVLGMAGAFAVNRSALMDWNFLAQKLTAAIVWIVALGAAYSALRPMRLSRAAVGVAIACLAPVALSAVVLTQDRSGADRTASYDPSFRLVSELVMPPAERADDTALYQFLLDNTNIARERKADAIDVVFDPSLAHSDAALPNVFIIVIDSLRRDYVNPFNPAVTFTPRLAEFAKDGVAFTNAFTRYGATGLSEPSIWVGGMLLHKQYVTPFAPQNALEKLLVAEQYRQFVSVDSILRVMFPADVPQLTELDQGRTTKDYNLCVTLPELQQQLDGARQQGGRLFAYTQPQNLHVSTITRENASVPGGGSYPGFYAPYAARMRQVDTCFGAFIDYLKQSGLYDSSIVIFTADHGDSLGEEGRFGHAYTVFPEIMRIPLIIKLAGDQSRLRVNQNAMVFSSDITPTLYELLGHTPAPSAFPFGQSLVAAPGTPPLHRRDPQLVASSYGAVYGSIEDEGQRIYITDAVNFQDYVYDLSDPLTSRRTAAQPDEAAASRKAIREGVETIRKIYKFGS